MTAVVIPWQEQGCPHRNAALDFTLNRLADLHPDWSLHLASLRDDVPWSKGAAIAGMLDSITDDRIVFADADCIVPPEALTAAVDALESHAWAVPHLRVYRLRPEATTDLLAGRPYDTRRLARNHYKGTLTGGIFAIRREAYLDSGGFDHGFVGWGGEDVSLSRVLTAMYGAPWRGTVDLHHLWHPPNSTQMPAPNKALSKRWTRATRDLDTLAAFIDERRQAWTPSA